MSKSSYRNRAGSVSSGFTLIELLVVVAIIAILAAILFPVFGRARENARRSSCQSNLKQLMLGVIQYQQDYDERFSPTAITFAAPATPGTVAWSQFIQPYIKSTQIFTCPSDKTLGTPNGTQGINGYIAPCPVSYGINGLFTEKAVIRKYATPGDPGIMISTVIQPSTTIYLMDGVSTPDETIPAEEWPEKSSPGGSGYIVDPLESSLGLAGAARGGPLARHLETCNAAFADGHVKAMKIEKFYYRATAPTPLSPWLNPQVGGS